jgi:hypothetical protein
MKRIVLLALLIAFPVFAQDSSPLDLPTCVNATGHLLEERVKMVDIIQKEDEAIEKLQKRVFDLEQMRTV